ncbi:hypothetical protein ZWY2020_021040 [Hordeum vulgare]|nr:hypothetical protein ZWY2020_021040 [Hordeum vulgare]
MAATAGAAAEIVREITAWRHTSRLAGKGVTHAPRRPSEDSAATGANCSGLGLKEGHGRTRTADGEIPLLCCSTSPPLPPSLHLIASTAAPPRPSPKTHRSPSHIPPPQPSCAIAGRRIRTPPPTSSGAHCPPATTPPQDSTHQMNALEPVLVRIIMSRRSICST